MKIQSMTDEELKATIAKIQEEVSSRREKEELESALSAAAQDFLDAVSKANKKGLGATVSLIHRHMPQEYVDWVAMHGLEIVKSVPEFSVPNDGMPGYQVGDYVIFQGNIYKSIVPDNRFSPLAYPQGWQVQEGRL